MLDDIAAAFVAGLEQGRAERVDLDVAELVQSELHRRGLESLNMARQHAAVKGPNWTRMMEEAGEAE